MLPSPTTADDRVSTARAAATSFVTTSGPGTGTRPSRDHLRSTVAEYLARHPVERDALSGLLAALEGEEDPTHRASLPGHITCCGVVIDADGQVLHVEHKASGLLLTPGGHVEAGDATLLAAALREIAEETGIPPTGLVLTPEFGRTPIDVDVHRIEADEAKGKVPMSTTTSASRSVWRRPTAPTSYSRKRRSRGPSGCRSTRSGRRPCARSSTTPPWRGRSHP